MVVTVYLFAQNTAIITVSKVPVRDLDKKANKLALTVAHKHNRPLHTQHIRLTKYRSQFSGNMRSMQSMRLRVVHLSTTVNNRVTFNLLYTALGRKSILFCDKGCTHKWKGTPKIGEHCGPAHLR